jgi:hypothetical protein
MQKRERGFGDLCSPSTIALNRWVKPIRTEHVRHVQTRRAVRNTDKTRHTSSRRPVQCPRSQSQHRSQRLGKGGKAPHWRHRCEHDRRCADPPPKIGDQLRDVAHPPVRPVESEHVVDTQCEHDEVNGSLWDFGNKLDPRHMRGCSTLPNGMPVHRSAHSHSEGGGNLPGKSVGMIRCPNTRDGRLTHHQESHRGTGAWDRPNCGTRSLRETRSVPSHMAPLQPQDRNEGRCCQRHRRHDRVPHRLRTATRRSRQVQTPACDRGARRGGATPRGATR